MKEKILTHVKNNPLLISFIALGAISLLMSQKEDPAPVKEMSQVEARSVDTFIPRGFVLVPIEIANAESLTSLVGDLGGVVDLYIASSGERPRGGRKVGSKLKLLRAPLNPQQYAVLVKETESSLLLSHSGPFIAVVQNPDEKGTQLTSSSGPSRVRVDYQN